MVKKSLKSRVYCLLGYMCSIYVGFATKAKARNKTTFGKKTYNLTYISLELLPFFCSGCRLFMKFFLCYDHHEKCEPLLFHYIQLIRFFGDAVACMSIIIIELRYTRDSSAVCFLFFQL
jgi:hypothetical protein